MKSELKAHLKALSIVLGLPIFIWSFVFFGKQVIISIGIVLLCVWYRYLYIEFKK